MTEKTAEALRDIFSGATKPETAVEALARWDAGKIVWSVSMGGLGPGYEQCIQCAAFEIIRDEHHRPRLDAEDKAATERWAEATLTRIDQELGMSGAQWGAAKTLAFRMLRDGCKAMVDSAPKDRRIQVNDVWPHVNRGQAMKGQG